MAPSTRDLSDTIVFNVLTFTSRRATPNSVRASPLSKKSRTRSEAKVRVEEIGSSQALSETVEPRNKLAPELLPTTKEHSPIIRSSSPPRHDHIILSNPLECEVFFCDSHRLDSYINNIRILEVHLDAGKLDDFGDYRLASALNALHPRPDGTNPHNIHIFRLIVKSNLLFTRYSYHLISPAMSSLVGEQLTKLTTDCLTQKEKKQLPYMINSTERGSSKALLGIRGVGEVNIGGKGHIEAGLAATIKATLARPPGTDVVETEDQGSPFSTHRMNRTGMIPSLGYGSKARLPYPTISGTIEYDFSRLTDKKRYLVDEKTELAAHLGGLDDKAAKDAAVFKPGQHGVANRPIPTIQVGPITRNRLRKRGGTLDMPEQWKIEESDSDPDELEEDEDKSLRMEDMVRIKVKKTYPEDAGFDIMDVNVIPVILTSREGTVEMGWKV